MAACNWLRSFASKPRSRLLAIGRSRLEQPDKTVAPQLGQSPNIADALWPPFICNIRFQRGGCAAYWRRCHWAQLVGVRHSQFHAPRAPQHRAPHWPPIRHGPARGGYCIHLRRAHQYAHKSHRQTHPPSGKTVPTARDHLRSNARCLSRKEHRYSSLRRC